MTLEYDDRDRASVLADLTGEDEEVRRLAVERVAVLQIEEAIPHLVERIGDTSWRVRKSAVERLVACPDREGVVGALIAALGDGENTGRRNSGVEALVECGGAGEAGWGNEDLYDPNNVNLESGRAPDLTHFMNRPRYAGAIYDLYPADEQGYIDYPYDPDTFQRTDLEAWLKNPPDRKAMYPEPGIDPSTGELIKPRGMPDLGLTDEQVDALVEYLTTLQ